MPLKDRRGTVSVASRRRPSMTRRECLTAALAPVVAAYERSPDPALPLLDRRYTTMFASTENPLSEGGAWSRRGLNNGLPTGPRPCSAGTTTQARARGECRLGRFELHGHSARGQRVRP
jgi:hypothetical protein